jgi:hypothetical protein
VTAVPAGASFFQNALPEIGWDPAGRSVFLFEEMELLPVQRLSGCPGDVFSNSFMTLTHP